MANRRVAFAIFATTGRGHGLDTVFLVLQRGNPTSNACSARSPAQKNKRVHAGVTFHPAGTFSVSLPSDLSGRLLRTSTLILIFFVGASSGSYGIGRRQRHGDRGDHRQHARVVAVRKVGIEPGHRTPEFDRDFTYLIAERPLRARSAPRAGTSGPRQRPGSAPLGSMCVRNAAGSVRRSREP